MPAPDCYDCTCAMFGQCDRHRRRGPLSMPAVSSTMDDYVELLKLRDRLAAAVEALRYVDAGYIARVIDQHEQYPTIDRGVLVALLRALEALRAAEAVP